MAQTGHITAVEDITTTGVEDTIYPKTHEHSMLTQVNAKQGLLKYGKKGSKALRQVHYQQNDKWETIYNNLACRQAKNITQEEGSSR